MLRDSGATEEANTARSLQDRKLRLVPWLRFAVALPKIDALGFRDAGV